MGRIAFTFFFLIFVFSLKAENISGKIERDSIKKDTAHSPRKAAIFSAVVPGLGQIYNGGKHWIKVPIIYAGFGGLTYGFVWNHKSYRKYRDALRIRYDGDPSTIDAYDGRYADNDLVTLKNYYRRYRDLCVIGAVALYTLNILDAAVFAHLKYFNVNDDLSMHFSPKIFCDTELIAPGIGLTFNFR